MTADIQSLQREVNEELTYIAARLEDRVEKFVIQDAVQSQEVKNRLEDLKQRVDVKLKEAEYAMDDVDQSARSYRSNTSLNTSQHVSDVKFVLESLCEIENILLMLNLSSPAPIQEAKLIKEAIDWLNALFQEGQRTTIVERIRSLLHKDLNFANSCLLTRLNQEAKELISFPGVVKGYNSMKIRVKSAMAISETLTALDILKEFRSKVAKWSDKIITDFCSVIINSRTGIECYECKSLKNDEYMFTANPKTSKDSVDINAVFTSLSRFFEDLHQAIGNIEIGSDSRPLTLFIGQELEEPLINLLLKNCISLAAPTADKNDPVFINAMNKANQFRSLMIKYNFWNDSASQFLAYAEANDSVFINRRCFNILTEAKKFILEPFIDLTTVGTEDEITEELISHFSDVFQSPVTIRDIAREDEAYPKFMQLQRCKVSTAAVKIVELLEKTTTDAVASNNDVLKARLLTTAQNILRLYNSLAPKHHAAAITSVPQAAAVYFNNSYYIAHRLILLPNLVVSRFPEEVQKLQNDVYPIVVDNLWILRESANESLEAMLGNTRRQISTLLADKDLFVELADNKKSNTCKKTIRACYQMISSIRDTWKEIMAEAVFCKSLGNIVSYFSADLATMFFNLEDIRSNDADVSAIILNDTLHQLEDLFMIRGKTTIHTFCESAYFRLKEVIFCLNGSLQSIGDRWCDRKGPLAQWLTPTEIRGLVKALFMNTDQRKHLLDTIC